MKYQTGQEVMFKKDIARGFGCTFFINGIYDMHDGVHYSLKINDEEHICGKFPESEITSEMVFTTRQLWELADHDKIENGKEFLYVDENQKDEYKLRYSKTTGKFNAFFRGMPTNLDMSIKDKWEPMQKTMTKEEVERILNVKIV